MARIYLAASYGRKEEMQKYAKDIENKELGVVTSRWIYRPGTCDVDVKMLHRTPDLCKKFALHDMEDMEASNCFILFTGDSLSTGGRHTELGMALRMKCIEAIYIIGPRENVFQCLDYKVHQFSSWKEFLDGVENARMEVSFADLASRVAESMLGRTEE